MASELGRNDLEPLLQLADVSNVTFAGLADLFAREERLNGYLPEGVCQIDPRNGERILYSRVRARRPRGKRVESHDAPYGTSAGGCPVCAGDTTGIIDLAGLSKGCTFINKNLYPALFPMGMDATPSAPARNPLSPSGHKAYGMHFVQWTSSIHGKDWETLPYEDRVVVMHRLAVLEEKLLKESEGSMPSAVRWGGPSGHYGFFSVMKNFGHLVGGSLEHGHQQIAFSNVMPRRYRDNLEFLNRNGEPFAAFMLRENPRVLTLRDYGPALLVVPYFMRHPFEMMLLLKDTYKGFLYQATPSELGALGKGWHDAIYATLEILHRYERTPAYNVVMHTGPGAGIYCEFLPFMQEMGGFEHLGLYVCQETPEEAAEILKGLFAE